MQSPQTLNAGEEFRGFVSTFRKEGLVSPTIDHYFAA